MPGNVFPAINDKIINIEVATSGVTMIIIQKEGTRVH